MKYILLLFIFIYSSSTLADTVVDSSSISQNTTFAKSKSPYVFNQDVTIQQGVMVTIEQGVKLIFNQGGLFIHKGSLVGNSFAIESKASNYNFILQCDACSLNINTVSVTGVPRSFISAWNESKIILNGVDVAYSSTAPHIVGIQAFNKSTLTVTNSSFTRLTKAFDLFGYSSTTILNSFFTYNDHAIYTFDSFVDVHESDFEYNHIAIEFFANLDVLPIVDAHNNWWGKGNVSPIYRDDSSQVQLEDINAIVGVVIYSPWSLEPHKKKDVATGTSNILFLPGLMGSRLYSKGTFENQLWEPNRSSDVKKLFLNSLGESILQNVYTRDIIAKTNITKGILDQSIYKDFTVYMNTLVKNNVIHSWKAAPYDWRYSPDTILHDGIVIGDGKKNTMMSLVSEVVNLAKTSKSKKVTLITHSNGGLVAKQLTIELKKQKLDSLIDKIIFVAMPEYGTPQAVTSLLYGHEQAIANGLILRATVARELGENMPSAYTLLPTDRYFNDGKTFSVDGIQIHSKTELNSVLLQKGNINPSLLTKADTFRTYLDTWILPPTIPVYQIVGTGVLTVVGVMKDGEGRPLPQYSTSGDGTVQDMYSQELHGFNRTGKIFIADLHDSKFSHSNIMNSSIVMNYIDLLIRKNPDEASYIPFGNYPVYPDTFTLLSISASSTELSKKSIQMSHIEGKDILDHDPNVQFDFSSSEDSEGRFDLFNKSIQYVSSSPVEQLKVTGGTNDVFDLRVYNKSVEGMSEIYFEDISLFQDSIMSLDFTASQLVANIDLPLLNKEMSINSKNTATPSRNLTERIAFAKQEIKISKISQYIKDRYMRRLDVISKNNDENALNSLRRSVEEGIKAIDRFSNNQVLRQKYAKLKQDYIYIVYLLK